MPRRIMQHFGIPTHQLSATQTTIYGFNANSTRLMGKIKLRCQIGELKSKVTCAVIDADTSYNLLLGRPKNGFSRKMILFWLSEDPWL